MANIQVTINVQTSGAQGNVQALNRNLDSLEKRLKTVQNLAKNALRLAGFGFGARQIIQLSDEFTNLQNRIRVVTNSEAELATVTDELFKISRETRASFAATTEIYARTVVATRNLGVSQAEVLSITKSLNEAIVLSGASAVEARAALIQLSQGIASGTLRGEELRSVLEQLPVVADVIANEMGVARGELIAFGKQGLITPQVIIKAFQNAEQEINQKFLKTIPTIGQAFVLIRNSVVRVIGDFQNATGASAAFAKSLIFLADNMETVARVAAAAGITIATVFVNQGIKKAIEGMKALQLLIARNPFGAIAIALVAIVSLLISFSDKLKIGSDETSTLADLGVATFERIKKAIQQLMAFLQPAFSAVVDFLSGIFGPIETSFSGFLLFTAKMLDRFIGLFVGTGKAIVVAFKNIPATLELIMKNALNGLVNLVEAGLNLIIRGINAVTDKVGIAAIPDIDIPTTQVSQEAEELGITARAAFIQGFGQTAIEGFVSDVVARAGEISKARLAEQNKAKLNLAPPAVDDDEESKGDAKLREFIQGLKDQARLLKKVGVQREVLSNIIEAQEQAERALTGTERELITELTRSNEVLKLQEDLYNDIQDPVIDFQLQVVALQNLLADGRITGEQFNEKLLELAKIEPAPGFEMGMKKITDSIRDTATLTEDALTNAFFSAEDALVNFVTTGKFEFKSLVDSILADLTRLLANQLLLSLIPGLGGGGAGPVPIGFNPLGRFAGGGSFTVGGTGGTDSQLVQFMATPGENVQVTPQGKGSNNPVVVPAPEVNLKVVNVTDKSEMIDLISSSPGERAILNVMEKNSNKISKMLSGK